MYSALAVVVGAFVLVAACVAGALAPTPGLAFLCGLLAGGVAVLLVRWVLAPEAR